ncbi:MAG: S8 family serine peptidase [Candidatus Delongbacteria bacterium]
MSAEISAEKALDISDKEFVRKIDILPKKNRPPVIDQVKPSQIEKDDFYGYTLGQVKQINIPSAHALGYYGQGTRLLMIDTGFDQDHEAFDSLTVVDEWDFIFNDGETGNDESDFTDQEGHGTACWSIAAGYAPGTFVGPAFRADFLLAKTEDYLNESTLEEDYMVAALEWGEARGADVASISLGYSTFDDPADNYTYADMDGQTAICTLGAKRAAYLGMVVCNSMGNSGNSSWKYLSAPSDADSIVSVGAVDINGNIASFSSYGPSYDGRIKPEVVAMGVSDYCASSGTSNRYTSGSGTSFSTPLVAGAACVVLSANPGWTNMQVREALMMTADRASDPDSTRYGWGLIDVLAAINYTQVEIFSEERTVQGFKLYQNYPNPFNPSTQISFELPVPGMVDLQIYDINGTKVETLIDSRKGAGIHTFTFDASKYSNGTFFYSLSVDGKTVAVKKMILIK